MFVAYHIYFTGYEDSTTAGFSIDDPIDAVYTWVNGSDPKFIDSLRYYKWQHRPAIKIRKCSNPKLCFKSNYVVVSPPLPDTYEEKGINSVIQINEGDLKLSLVEFDSVQNSDKFKPIKFHDRVDVYFTLNADEYTMKSTKFVLTKKSVGSRIETENLNLEPDILFKSTVADFLENNDIPAEDHLMKLFFSCDCFVGGLDSSKSRFVSNDELKYSLRGLEKHAPWIRKIFLVTNGQVPNWLDMDSPKIEIVTHEEIFVNKSHLPTFSSAAIETHLHRIPGLSDNFLYLNDDIIINQPITPHDFYDPVDGWRIYLAWDVPQCAPECPNNWIKDGYCDKLCNVEACEFDGGDCEGKEPVINGPPDDSWVMPDDLAAQLALGEDSGLNLIKRCSEQCLPTWLGDKFCDHGCNNQACAYDMGDCGTFQYNQLLSFDLFELRNSTTIILDPSVNNFYFNLTRFLPFTLKNGEVLCEKATIIPIYQSHFQVLTFMINTNVTMEIELTVLMEFDNETNIRIEILRSSQDSSVNNKNVSLSNDFLNLTDEQRGSYSQDELRFEWIDGIYIKESTKGSRRLLQYDQDIQE